MNIFHVMPPILLQLEMRMYVNEMQALEVEAEAVDVQDQEVKVADEAVPIVKVVNATVVVIVIGIVIVEIETENVIETVIVNAKEDLIAEKEIAKRDQDHLPNPGTIVKNPPNTKSDHVHVQEIVKDIIIDKGNLF